MRATTYKDMTQHPRIPTREYKLFLLRVWRETPQDEWRISIQENHQSIQMGMPNLDALLNYVREELREEDVAN